ncbi:MAG: vitamin K epoxide reductase family protein [Longimicrobiales bacterium]
MATSRRAGSPDARNAPVESDPPSAPPPTRMAIALLALVGTLISTYLLLHTLGWIGVLVCGAGDCDLVQSSAYASFLGAPVPAWGVIGYGALLAVALASIQERWLADRRVAILLFTLATLGFAFSAYLTFVEAFVLRLWCRWCIGSAVIATCIFLLAWPELNRSRNGLPR